MNAPTPYPIGTPGQRWGAAEVAAWRALQSRKRSYAEEVLPLVERLGKRFDVEQYGWLDYDQDGCYPLYALRSRDWDQDLPVALVTGGVHGYETSGVHGALRFLDRHAEEIGRAACRESADASGLAGGRQAPDVARGG